MFILLIVLFVYKRYFKTYYFWSMFLFGISLKSVMVSTIFSSIKPILIK